MKKEKLLLFEEIHRIHEITNVNPFQGKHLVVVDIQPEYQSYINFLGKFVDFLNENHDTFSNITFLYNGYNTLGMVNENEYKIWWYDMGLDETILNDSVFYDKGYAFFRYCMDSNVDESDIVELVKFMIEMKVNETRDLDSEFWDGFVERYGKEDLRELLEHSGDFINIPDLMDVLSEYNNIVLCGGGINECLKEVEIALMGLDKPYSVITKYTY